MGLTVVDAPVMAMACVKPTMSTVKLRRMQDLQEVTQQEQHVSSVPAAG
jgi:hypothetical protein